MSQPNHNERDHALLSASKAERWLNCTPSARLEETVPDESTSIYAQEGTLAHEYAQLCITKDILNEISDTDYDTKFDEIVNSHVFNEEMLDEVPKYVDYVEQAFTVAKVRTPDAMLLVEQKVDFSKFVKEGFGTDDAIIIADDILEVIDLKYGKGVYVSAENNSQLKLYAIGALEKFGMLYDIHKVVMTIVQPRRDNISSFTLTVQDLYEWAETELRDKAILAYSGIGEQVPGDWCKFCKVKHKCVAIAKYSLELAQDEFREPYLLTDEQVAETLSKASVIKEFVSGIEAYAFKMALGGKKWPGYKLVEGISRRKFVDENKVIGRLLEQPDLSDEDIYITKLQGITNLQKKLGKKRFDELLSNLIIKPQGAPTLVEDTDKRPEINNIITDFGDTYED